MQLEMALEWVDGTTITPGVDSYRITALSGSCAAGMRIFPAGQVHDHVAWPGRRNGSGRDIILVIDAEHELCAAIIVAAPLIQASPVLRWIRREMAAMTPGLDSQERCVWLADNMIQATLRHEVGHAPHGVMEDEMLGLRGTLWQGQARRQAVLAELQADLEILLAAERDGDPALALGGLVLAGLSLVDGAHCVYDAESDHQLARAALLASVVSANGAAGMQELFQRLSARTRAQTLEHVNALFCETFETLRQTYVNTIDTAAAVV